jgi:spermidine synthase
LRRLALAFVVMGFTCSVSQVLLAREFMNIFCGNELILGVLFVNWMLCIALGSWGLGGLTDRYAGRRELLAVTLILVSVVLPIQVLFVRSMVGWITVERGEMVGLPSTFIFMFLALLPFCTLHGFQFALGCRLVPSGEADGSTAQITRVYVLEALGSVLGGLAFTYLLVHRLQVLEMSVSLGVLNLSQALFLLAPSSSEPVHKPRSKLLAVISILLIMFGGLAVLSGRTAAMETVSQEWRWDGLGLVHSQNSVYGEIAVTMSDEQSDFWVNGLPVFTMPDPNLELIEEIAHLPMLQHSSPKKILIVGGGLGGVLKEVLRHEVVGVTYVELDPLLIDLAQAYSLETRGVLEDTRVELVHMDGRLLVKKSKAVFDVAIVNLPPPSTLQLNRYYSLEFFMEVEEALSENGVVSIGLPSSTTHISAEMGARNRCVYNTIKSVFPSCMVVPGYHNLFIASKNGEEHALTSDPHVLNQRILDRGLEPALLTEDYLVYKFDPERMEISLAYLNEKNTELNRDMRPVAAFHDLALWNIMLNPQMRSLFSLPSDVDIWLLLVTLCVLAFLVSSALRRSGRVLAPVYLAIFTTGLAGMTFSIINLYVFQALCGYLYQDLGVVAAAFMLGLALGGWYMGQRRQTRGWGVSTLMKTEVGIIAYSLMVPPTVSLLSTHIATSSNLFLVRGILPVLNVAAGFLVGMEFSLASGICLEEVNRVGGVGGALYATDLVGACVGSFFSSIWLIPLYGVQGSCLVVAVANVASLILVYSMMRWR